MAMLQESGMSGGIIEAPPRYSEWQRFRRVFFGRWLVIVGLVIITATVLVAIFADVLAPYDPYNQAGSISWELMLSAETR